MFKCLSINLIYIKLGLQDEDGGRGVGVIFLRETVVTVFLDSLVVQIQ